MSARLHAVAATLGALAAAPMVLGAAGDRVALLALADHFQPQYALALTAVVVSLSLLRRWRLALPFAALLLAPALRLAPYVPARARDGVRGSRRCSSTCRPRTPATTW